jgi:hypothetical protein
MAKKKRVKLRDGSTIEVIKSTLPKKGQVKK